MLFGLHDFNSEFYALEHAAGLFNSSFGIGIDVSQVGPSIFPTTSLAGRIKILPSENSYFVLAAYDGIPGSPNDQVGTQISFDSNDGMFYSSEIGLVGDEDNYFKLGLGAWYHTTDFIDYSEIERSSNYGGYLIAEENLSENFGTFLQFGLAKEDRNQVGNYIGSGLTYTGPLTSRPDDMLSLGVAIARISDDYKKINNTDSHETTLELNYRLQTNSFLAITPDIQYIINPGTDSSIDDSLVLGFRTELTL